MTDDMYTKMDQELESKIYELNLEQTKETRENSELHLTVANLFNLTKRLPEVFKSSKPEEKNQILKFLISNSLQTGQKAELNLAKPFSFLYKNQQSQQWLTVVDSLRTFDWVSFEQVFSQFEQRLGNGQTSYQLYGTCDSQEQTYLV